LMAFWELSSEVLGLLWLMVSASMPHFILQGRILLLAASKLKACGTNISSSKGIYCMFISEIIQYIIHYKWGYKQNLCIHKALQYPFILQTKVHWWGQAGDMSWVILAAWSTGATKKFPSLKIHWEGDRGIFSNLLVA
jgi:hypothetical protein